VCIVCVYKLGIKVLAMVCLVDPWWHGTKKWTDSSFIRAKMSSSSIASKKIHLSRPLINEVEGAATTFAPIIQVVVESYPPDIAPPS